MAGDMYFGGLNYLSEIVSMYVSGRLRTAISLPFASVALVQIPSGTLTAHRKCTRLSLWHRTLLALRRAHDGLEQGAEDEYPTAETVGRWLRWSP